MPEREQGKGQDKRLSEVKGWTSILNRHEAAGLYVLTSI